MPKTSDNIAQTRKKPCYFCNTLKTLYLFLLLLFLGYPKIFAQEHEYNFFFSKNHEIKINKMMGTYTPIYICFKQDDREYKIQVHLIRDINKELPTEYFSRLGDVKWLGIGKLSRLVEITNKYIVWYSDNFKIKQTNGIK